LNIEQMQAKVVKATQEWASVFTHLPLEKWWRALPKVLEILLVILLAKAAADITWLIFTPAQETATAPSVTSRTARRQPQTQQARLSMVANLHVFGMAAPQGMAGGGPINAVETGLKLTLRGVFASDQPQNSLAIVADQQNQEHVYARGEVIVAGVTLYEVYPDRIILNRNGSYETLSMPQESKDVIQAAPSVAPRTSRNSRMAPPPTPAPSANSADVLKNLQQDMLKRPEHFWNQVRIDPFTEDGTVKGFKFTHRDPQVMQALGIQPTDVVVDVNGSPATDPAVMQSLMGNISGPVTLGVLRNGQRIELRLSM
jgi:general secretion pathway protein C